MSMNWFIPTDFPLGGFQEDITTATSLVFGVPYDQTASFRPGCGNAPSNIRYYSSNIEGINPYTYVDISEVLIHDLGDLIFEDITDLKFKVAKIFNELTKDKEFTLMLGGEHTITSFVPNKNLLYLILDAHGDLRDTYLGNPFSHACTSRRIVEQNGSEAVIQFGIRALSKEEINYSRSQNITQYYSISHNGKQRDQILKEVESRISSFDGLYLSIDMDGFDPAYAPGVGNPETLGLSPKQVFDLISRLPRINYADITELNPLFDISGISGVLASRLASFLLTMNKSVDEENIL